MSDNDSGMADAIDNFNVVSQDLPEILDDHFILATVIAYSGLLNKPIDLGDRKACEVILNIEPGLTPLVGDDAELINQATFLVGAAMYIERRELEDLDERLEDWINDLQYALGEQIESWEKIKKVMGEENSPQVLDKFWRLLEF